MVAAPPNAAPEVHIRASTRAISGDSTELHLTWEGHDPDGRVDHYLFRATVGQDDQAPWLRTGDRGSLMRIARHLPVAMDRPRTDILRTFSVQAVDNEGAVSEPAEVTIVGDDIAPTLRILQPPPSRLLENRVPPDIHVAWDASDADGPRGLPKEIRYYLLPRRGHEDLFQAIELNPDTLNTLYGPTFSNWASVRGDSTGVIVRDLRPGERYLLMATAIDREGAYDPVFSLSKNVVRLNVFHPGLQGPVITLFNDTFFYRYVTGGMDDIPIDVQISAGVRDEIRWFASPADENEGHVTGYRWALDPIELSDETHRHGPADVRHWSEWSAETCASIPAYPGLAGERHNLYVEARDVVGWTSIGHVRMTVVKPTYERPLLIVNDTRFQADLATSFRPDSLQPPGGEWPSAAELDTFLFARGGVRWRMTPNGTVSPPGVFAGYDCDTLGTRLGIENPTPALEFLSRYRHVIWMVDARGAQYSPTEIGGSPMDRLYPETALRYMSSPNRRSTLAAYVHGGGSAWLVGGGAARATLAEWNRRENDLQGLLVLSSSGERPDLGPGRFMYDLAGWRSTIEIGPVRHATIHREVFAGGPGSLSYAMLPEALQRKDPAIDPLYPFRTSELFYLPLGPSGLEWLAAPNVTGDPRNPSPRHAQDIHTLDTLYIATGDRLLDRTPTDNDLGISPVMTVEHSATHGPVVFSGFDLWHLRQDQSRQLVDAVLRVIWGLSRSTTTAAAHQPVGGPIPSARISHASVSRSPSSSGRGANLNPRRALLLSPR